MWRKIELLRKHPEWESRVSSFLDGMDSFSEWLGSIDPATMEPLAKLEILSVLEALKSLTIALKDAEQARR